MYDSLSGDGFDVVDDVRENDASQKTTTKQGEVE
jgi:hypothetical protein